MIEKHAYRLVGENLELSQREIEKVLEAESKDLGIERRDRWLVSDKINMPRRLARAHSQYKILGTSIDEVPKPKASFKVECPKTMSEEELGQKLQTSENRVDLENPDKIIRAVPFGSETLYGELSCRIDRGLFNQRENHKRPFSAPISMPPQLARTAVNLAAKPLGSKIIDPFCGTGGILIEAGLCGIKPFGVDCKEEMVKGTRKNLENYGVVNHNIKTGTASETEFEEDIDCFVTDIPYGKSTVENGEIYQELRSVISKYGEGVFIADREDVLGMQPEFEIDVHSSMTRFIYIVE